MKIRFEEGKTEVGEKYLTLIIESSDEDNQLDEFIMNDEASKYYRQLMRAAEKIKKHFNLIGQEQMNEIDWITAPKEAKYHAKDADGKRYWYKDKPTRNEHYHKWQANCFWRDETVECSNWRSTLTERPKDKRYKTNNKQLDK